VSKGNLTESYKGGSVDDGLTGNLSRRLVQGQRQNDPTIFLKTNRLFCHCGPRPAPDRQSMRIAMGLRATTA